MLNQYTKTAGVAQSSIIILSEFMEGAWEAIRFSVKNLVSPQHGLVYVQTYRKPDFGQSLLHNFVPVMEKFARDELTVLKKRTLKEFDVQDERVFVCPFEGDFLSFIQFKQTAYNPDFVVVSMKAGFSGAPSLVKKACRLAACTTKPLFILPENIKENPVLKVLYLSEKKDKTTEKTNCLSKLQSLNKDITIHFHLPPDKHDGGLAVLTDELQPDLLVLDQNLLQTGTQRRRLKLKNWLKKDQNIPLLVV